MTKRQTATNTQQQDQTQDQIAQAQSPMQEMPPMHLDVRVRPVTPKGNLLAYASVNMNGCFAVDGIKVLSSETKGIFVAMPSYKEGNGQYRDVCFPVTQDFHRQLSQAVITGYHQTLEQMREASMKAMQQEQAPQEAPEMTEPAMAM